MNHMSKNVNQKSQHAPPAEADDGIVRATYTMPSAEADAIEALRRRVTKSSDDIPNRSEIVRLGLLALQGMSDLKLKALMRDLERYRPGRKKTGRKSAV